MTDFPLTPGEAIVLATFLEEHAKLPHLVALVDRLRAWARTQTAATEEGEMPSQTAIPGPRGGILGSRNRAVPQGAETPGGPNRPTSTELAGDEQL